MFLNPYTFLNKQLDLIQDYPLSDGLNVLDNLRMYLNQEAQKPLSQNLFTAFIHKFPTKESTHGMSENTINEIIWAYDKQAKLLLDQHKYLDSLALYKLALEIKSDHYKCLGNYAVALLKVSQKINDPTLIDEALFPLQQALIGFPDETYNLACYYSVKKELELAKEKILHAEICGTLPPLDHIENDIDLNNIRSEHWFIELLERLKNKDNHFLVL